MKNLSIPAKIVYSEKVLYSNVETEKKVYFKKCTLKGSSGNQNMYSMRAWKNPFLELLCLIMWYNAHFYLLVAKH